MYPTRALLPNMRWEPCSLPFSLEGSKDQSIGEDNAMKLQSVGFIFFI